MASFVDRLAARLDPPRRLSFTRTGGYFVLVTLGVGVAAINTGNNLLFLLLGMMLSVIVAPSGRRIRTSRDSAHPLPQNEPIAKGRSRPVVPRPCDIPRNEIGRPVEHRIRGSIRSEMNASSLRCLAKESP